MGVKRKASAVEEQAPPLLDEHLPTTDTEEQQPPLPDEEPPPLPENDVPEEQPPLPDEPAPLPNEPLPDDEPSPSASSDLEDSDVESETSTPNPETALTQTTTTTTATAEPDAWQAIWEPAANAYYFYNTQTHETTWLNPRLPPSEAAAYLAAHPPQLPPQPGTTNPPAPEDVYDPETGEYAFTARFNAKTGKFQNNPEHTAENFSTQGQLMRTAKEYFDVNQMMEGKQVGASGGALRADRRQMMRQMSKKQRREFIEKCKKKKDDKKREWYRNDDIIVRKH